MTCGMAKGRFMWANGETYSGDYRNDERTGQGIYLWPDGSRYEGDFLSGMRHGRGVFVSSSGVIYEGEWFDDLQHGAGTLTYTDGRIVSGIWRYGNLVTQPAPLPANSDKPTLAEISSSEVKPTKLLTDFAFEEKNVAKIENSEDNINDAPASSLGENEAESPSKSTDLSKDNDAKLKKLPSEETVLSEESKVVEFDKLEGRKKKQPLMKRKNLIGLVRLPKLKTSLLQI